MKSFLLITAGVALLGGPALAQDMQKMDMSKMKDMKSGMMMKNTAANPYAESEMAMGHKMMMAEGGDAAMTYAKKMIEHHQGAIDMSRIAIARTQDSELKRIAQNTIDENKKGQATLRTWIMHHGG